MFDLVLLEMRLLLDYEIVAGNTSPWEPLANSYRRSIWRLHTKFGAGASTLSPSGVQKPVLKAEN